MIVAGLLVVGAALLLVAPRWHRQVLGRAQTRADVARRQRVDELRARPGSAALAVPGIGLAHHAARRLLLRGVRVEIVDDSDGVTLVHDAESSEAVAAVVRELMADDANE
jgi:hypothetical protein